MKELNIIADQRDTISKVSLFYFLLHGDVNKLYPKTNSPITTNTSTKRFGKNMLKIIPIPIKNNAKPTILPIVHFPDLFIKLYEKKAPEILPGL